MARGAQVGLLSVLGLICGSVGGWMLGQPLYEIFGPPWAQWGSEFEGFGVSMVCALIGGLAGSIGLSVIGWRLNRR